MNRLFWILSFALLAQNAFAIKCVCKSSDKAKKSIYMDAACKDETYKTSIAGNDCSVLNGNLYTHYQRYLFPTGYQCYTNRLGQHVDCQEDN